ncbi:hypothetical protein K6X13_10965 [Xanthomonas euvesicatoria pv. allii]|uniref:hypothetical protein n=1 Tax=Xanthomonas euvesicatoria TaxID=456327 RepID=UPI0024067C4A|nr:hypothetical protein [Xanthomonas euvesicatoria]MCP3047608.1 hypothetical protein [Xanthomonas euvesicatoria pv. allii]
MALQRRFKSFHSNQLLARTVLKSLSKKGFLFRAPNACACPFTQCLTGLGPVMSFACMGNASAIASLLCQPLLRAGAGVAGITTIITTATIRPVRSVVFA